MIIIIGDSWGVGEWGHQCDLNGPGVGQYLSLHNEVINLSIGAASNTLSLNRLERLLDRFSLNDDDTIYWIVTCPSRCVTEEKFLESEKLIDVINLSLESSLSRANTIAQKNNGIIKLIGGLCDLDSVDISNFKSLNNIVPSWGKLLNQDYHSFIGGCHYWGELGIKIKNSRKTLLDEWINIAEQYNKKYQSWQKMKSTYFGTDGVHPDRRGHLALRNFLYPQWVHKF